MDIIKYIFDESYRLENKEKKSIIDESLGLFKNIILGISKKKSKKKLWINLCKI